MKAKIISLFTGIGGLDLGFREAGFRTAVAVEFDPECCKTLRGSRLTRSWPLLEGDIHGISSRRILRKASLRAGEADVLVAGPPCQPFSKAGYWANGDSGRLADERADTLLAFLRVLRDTRPRTFLLENVRGLAYRLKRDGLDLLLRGVDEINRDLKTNYRVQWFAVDAADYGVPQHRERILLIASRDGAPFSFPSPTHSSATDGNGLQAYRSVWDSIGDLPERADDPALAVGGKWGDLLPTIPEGENYLWHTARGGGEPLFGWRTRYWTFLLKLAKDRPSWTIQAHPGTATGPFHWKNRRLSAEELARLQTLPDGLNLEEASLCQVQRMVGNAVPSLLAEVVAREIKSQLLGGRRRSHPPALLPPNRGPAPRAERRHPLRRKYAHLIGEHTDHPGPGLGPRARRGARRRANRDG